LLACFLKELSEIKTPTLPAQTFRPEFTHSTAISSIVNSVFEENVSLGKIKSLYNFERTYYDNCIFLKELADDDRKIPIT
jgi:hypothetical protein